jgi:hypothetical protein
VPLPHRERRKKGVRPPERERERERPKQAKSLKRSMAACIDEEGRRSSGKQRIERVGNPPSMHNSVKE